MPTLNLKIFIPDKNATKTYPLDQSLHVYQICDHVREKENLKDHQAQDWGIFLSDEDPKKGIWLEEARSLEYYLLRDGDQLEYKKKIRPLKVKMMDESIKTVLVDDSQAVSQLMVVICGRIGIANYEEYSLVREPLASETSAYHTGTLSRGSGTKEPLYNTLRGRVSGDGTLNRPVKDGAKDSMSKDERKMESLRRKLHTDDEINWVDNCKTLREQGIEEFEILLLRRKFFYSDQNIDSHDPVQLNLLYVQCRDAIINGTHPVTLEQACKFAGIQCQILYGDHNPLKHKSGFLDLQELIVKDFRKMKGLEKKIYEEHKTFCGSNEIDSKVSYVKLARALKTYGVTFFLVKEKMKGKNRLRPRLLGITKDSVLKLDEQTKEMVQTWPLTRVKRWGATPHSFTLDFGDYQDGYYSVQTADGEKISSLIAGYIDIIMKNRGNKKGGGSNKNGTALESCEVGYNIPYRYDGDEWANMQESLTRGDEESTLIEEIVSPHRATYIKFPSSSPLTGKLNSSTKTAPSGSTYIDNVPGPYIGSRSGRVVFNGPAHPTGRTRFLADPAHKECLERGILRIGTALDKLNNRDNRDTNGKKNQGGDMNEFKIEGERRRRVRFVEDKIARITAGSARIMSLVALPSSDTHEMGVEGAGQEEDFALSLRVAVTDVADSLEGLLKEINVIESETNGMDDENRTTLLNAVKELALATTGLLECLRSDNDLLANQENNSDQHEMNENGEHSDPVRLRIALIASHLNRVGECGALVLTALGDEPNMHDASLNQSNENGIRELMGCAKGVANAAAHLVLRAKHIANEVGSEGETRERIVGAATHCALKTSQLITCVKVMAPTIHNEVCKTQTIQSAQAVTQSVNHVLMIAQESTDNQKLLTDLNQAASQVLCALDRLIENVTKGFEPERDARNTSPPDISDLMLERKEIQAFSNIRSATEILLNSLSKQNTANRTGTDEDNAINTNLMIQQARIVAQATADLVSAIKLEAHKFDQGSPSGNAEDETENNKRKKSLFDSAKRLAEATTKLVECAKFFSSSDQKNDISKEIQAEKFAEAAVNLRYATKNALDTISSNRIIKEFRSAARKSISSANDVLNVTKHLIASDSLDLANNVDANKNLYAYDFISHCKLVGDRLTDLIRSVEVCDVSHNGKHPEKSCSPDSNKFSRVIQTCDECLIPAQQLLHQTDRVEDSGSIPGRVNYFVRDLTKSLSRLKTCSHKCSSLSAELTDCLLSKLNNPQSPENSRLISLARLFDINLDKSPKNGAVVEIINRKQLEQASRAIVEASSVIRSHYDKCRDGRMTPDQQQILTAATIIAKHTSSLCNCCRVASSKTMDPQHKRFFVESAKNVANSTRDMVTRIKGLQAGTSQRSSGVEDIFSVITSLNESVDNLIRFAARINCSPGPDGGYRPESESGFPDPSSFALTYETGKACQEPFLEACRSVCDAPVNYLAARDLGNSNNDIHHSISSHEATFNDSAKYTSNLATEMAPGIKGCKKFIHSLDAVLSELEDGTIKDGSTLSQPLLPNNPQGMNQNLNECLERLVNHLDHTVQNAQNCKFELIEYQLHLTTLDIRHLAKICQSLDSSGRPLYLTRTLKAVITGQLKPFAFSLLAYSYSSAKPDRSTFLNRLNRNYVMIKNRLATSFNDDRTGGDENADDISLGLRKILEDVDSDNYPNNFKENGALARDIFLKHRDTIIQTARKLVEDSKMLVSSCTTTSQNSSPRMGINNLDPNSSIRDSNADTTWQLEDHLGASASSAVRTLAQLSQRIKMVAHELYSTEEDGINPVTERGKINREIQSLLINSIKDIATSLGDLIQASKQATNKHISDPAMIYLKQSAKVMVSNVTGLLKTLKNIEDSTLREVSALENTIESIGQELRLFECYHDPVMPISPEILIDSCNKMAADLRIITSGFRNGEDSVSDCCEISRRNIADFLRACKGVACHYMSEHSESKTKLLDFGKEIGLKYKHFLQISLQILMQNADFHHRGFDGSPPCSTSQLDLAEEDLADALDRISRFLRFVLPRGVYSPDTTERELLRAAVSIETAAREIAPLPSSASIVSPICNNNGYYEDLDTLEYKLSDQDDLNKRPFDERIVSAAQAIANAAASLIRASCAAQKELVRLGKLSPNTLPPSTNAFYVVHANDKDTGGGEGQWSYGLISAAKLVVAATHSLCQAADVLVKNPSNTDFNLNAEGMERLITSAKQVASGTAQLLLACRVKAGIYNPVTERLDKAGNAIKRATERLIQCAADIMISTSNSSFDLNTGSFYEEGDSRIRYLSLDKRMVGSLAQEMEAQQEILRKERELEEARIKLGIIRKAKYKDKNPTFTPEPDIYEISNNNNVDNNFQANTDYSFTSDF